MKLKIFALTSLLALFLVLTSCTTIKTYDVGVNSIKTPESRIYKKYYLYPATKGVTEDDIQFKEYATYVHRALKQHGFKRKKNINDAEMMILLDYSVGEGKDHYYTYASPTWGQTGYSSSSTYGTLNTYGNYGSYNSTTTYTPRYGITGYTTQLGSYTTRFKFVSLTAFNLVEYRKSKRQIQLWGTNIGNNNGDGDLRKIMPIMLAAASPYIAGNTGRIVFTKINENDPKIDDVLGIVREAPQAKRN